MTEFNSKQWRMRRQGNAKGTRQKCGIRALYLQQFFYSVKLIEIINE